MRFIIEKIDILSCAKISSALYGMVSLLASVIYIFLSLFTENISEMEIISFIQLIGVSLLMPFFYAVLGFGLGALMAYIFNQSAHFLGGLIIDLKQLTKGK